MRTDWLAVLKHLILSNFVLKSVPHACLEVLSMLMCLELREWSFHPHWLCQLKGIFGPDLIHWILCLFKYSGRFHTWWVQWLKIMKLNCFMKHHFLTFWNLMSGSIQDWSIHLSVHSSLSLFWVITNYIQHLLFWHRSPYHHHSSIAMKFMLPTFHEWARVL